MTQQDVLKLAVAGITGKMGKDIGQCITHEPSVMLTVATTRRVTSSTVSELIGSPGYAFEPTSNLQAQINAFDVLIDFTQPDSTLENLAICANNQKPIVIGTTGFTAEQHQAIYPLTKQIPIVMASNMSRGITLLKGLLKTLTQKIGVEADIEILEAHHRYKKDAPSGTALTLGETIAETLNQPLDKIATYERHGISERGRENKIGFSVIRAGDIVGEHTAVFALDGERIEVKHIASNRSTFSLGAIAAAKWLHGKPAGLYSMEDVLS